MATATTTTATPPAGPTARWHELNFAVDAAWRRVDRLLRLAAMVGAHIPARLEAAILEASDHYDVACEAMEEYEERRRKGGRS